MRSDIAGLDPANAEAVTHPLPQLASFLALLHGSLVGGEEWTV